MRVRDVRVERGRSFGDVWLGWLLWQALELDKFCAAALPEGREQVPWADIAMILVVARLCKPSSELHIAEDWYRRTALEDLIGIDPKGIHHTRLYEGLDKLLDHKEELEAHLKNRLGTLLAAVTFSWSALTTSAFCAPGPRNSSPAGSTTSTETS